MLGDYMNPKYEYLITELISWFINISIVGIVISLMSLLFNVKFLNVDFMYLLLSSCLLFAFSALLEWLYVYNIIKFDNEVKS